MDRRSFVSAGVAAALAPVLGGLTSAARDDSGASAAVRRSGTTRWADEPAPAPGTQPRRLLAADGAVTEPLPDLTRPVVFYSPHADDEVLSMGVGVGNALAAGRDVLLVLLTLGCSQGMLDSLNGVAPDRVSGVRHDPVAEFYLGPLAGGLLDAATASASRAVEFRSAAGALAGFGRAAGAGRLAVSVVGRSEGLAQDDVRTIMLAHITRYPGATHATTSWTDAHPDHNACGAVLEALRESGSVTDPQFYVQPGREKLAVARGVPVTAVKPAAGVADAVRRACGAYQAWNPAAGSYGFGYRSVPSTFTAMLRTPVNHVH